MFSVVGIRNGLPPRSTTLWSTCTCRIYSFGCTLLTAWTEREVQPLEEQFAQYRQHTVSPCKSMFQSVNRSLCCRRINPVTISGFYFPCSAGNEIQMTREGLLRTLLPQALRTFPNIAPLIFPKRLETFVAFRD
ncbi:uncharacterized protein K444DRAFT_692797 [Hyaloscypha bicolor E]|uniref:Uncharacterized protein n=1 Tax=Hyaloscypha bicolor E TaxID=1095630 RepID=A0A2J6T2H5_9HELO|nr:uncharacterized protein K444DRAFT_692797 [Hyaloscypha bicolor E]PMD57224.1 hypothetical protein K444DRAFT_692797 [Hyaloscypha bicolor E]